MARHPKNWTGAAAIRVEEAASVSGAAFSQETPVAPETIAEMPTAPETVAPAQTPAFRRRLERDAAYLDRKYIVAPVSFLARKLPKKLGLVVSARDIKRHTSIAIPRLIGSGVIALAESKDTKG